MTFSWSSFEDLVKMFAPMVVAAVIPGGAMWGPVISGAIIVAQDVHGAGTGPVKRADVLAEVTNVATALNTGKATPVVDPAMLAAQAAAAIDLTIGIVNDVQKAQVAPPKAA